MTLVVMSMVMLIMMSIVVVNDATTHDVIDALLRQLIKWCCSGCDDR